MREEYKVKGRKILNPLISLVIRLGISANLLTLASLPFSFLAGYFFWQGLRYWGGLFLILVALADTIDGEVARRTNQISKYGAFLDSVVDRISEAFIYLGFFLYYLDHSEKKWILILVFTSLIASLLVSYIRARAEGIGKDCKIGFMERPVRMIALLIGVFVLGYKFLPISFAIIFMGSLFTIMQRILYVLKR
ncbi:MAG: CDP-alcohol phosphatidyltransferase family protein [candidate division WOR-3 bacterium]